jgi:hypothetical protein
VQGQKLQIIIFPKMVARMQRLAGTGAIKAMQFARLTRGSSVASTLVINIRSVWHTTHFCNGDQSPAWDLHYKTGIRDARPAHWRAW